MAKVNKSAKTYSTRLSVENEEFILLKAHRDKTSVATAVDNAITIARKLEEMKCTN
jgi:hypothetical protein